MATTCIVAVRQTGRFADYTRAPVAAASPTYNTLPPATSTNPREGRPRKQYYPYSGQRTVSIALNQRTAVLLSGTYSHTEHYDHCKRPGTARTDECRNNGKRTTVVSLNERCVSLTGTHVRTHGRSSAPSPYPGYELLECYGNTVSLMMLAQRVPIRLACETAPPTTTHRNSFNTTTLQRSDPVCWRKCPESKSAVVIGPSCVGYCKQQVPGIIRT